MKFKLFKEKEEKNLFLFKIFINPIILSKSVINILNILSIAIIRS